MAKIKWTVEIEVEDVWVADGFDLTDKRAHDMVTRDLSYAYEHEIKCKIVSKPIDQVIADLQGYPTVAEYRKARDK